MNNRLLDGEFSSNMMGEVNISINENFHDVDGHETLRQPMRKKYKRHTPEQIEEMERVFEESTHPSELEKRDLCDRLHMELKQVNFWFQNRRTHTKERLDRFENMRLKHENEALKHENMTIMQGLSRAECNSCGDRITPNEMLDEKKRLLIEHSQLSDQIAKLQSTLTKIMTRPLAR